MSKKVRNKPDFRIAADVANQLHTADSDSDSNGSKQRINLSKFSDLSDQIHQSSFTIISPIPWIGIYIHIYIYIQKKI